jgi:diguanylate cyclase (GGDEF)-like protein/PAS domain S-box-containing protein
MARRLQESTHTARVMILLILLGFGAVLLALYGPPRTFRRAPDAFLRAAAVAGAAAGVCHLAFWFFFPEWQQGFDGAYAVVGLCATSLALAASRSPRLDESIRASWRRIGAGLASAWLGDIVFAHANPGGVGARAGLSDLAYLAADALIFWGLVSLPVVARSRREARQFWLDAVTLALCTGMLFLYPWHGGEATAGSAWSHALQGVYLLGDGLLVLGIAVALLRQRDRGLRWPLWLLAASLGCGTLTDVAWIAGTPALVELTSLGFWAFVGAAAIAQLRVAAEAGQPADVTPRFFSVSLPYVVIGATQLALLAGAIQNPDSVARALVGGALLLTVVVTVRQALTFRENMRLLEQQKEREAEARLASLVRNASDVILVVGPDLRIRYSTPSVQRVLRHAPQAVLGSSLLALFEPAQKSEAAALVYQALRSLPIRHEAELKALRGDGSTTSVHVSAQSLADDPHVGGVVLTLRDIHDRKLLEARLTHQAFHDPLTNLANRSLVTDRLQHALARRHRHVAVLAVDIDDFKGVNDTLGHACGDQALTEAARRVVACVRPADTVGRLGGDDFVVVLEDVKDLAEALSVAGRVSAAFGAPFELLDKEIGLSASIGIALSGEALEEADEILRNADVALYMAKSRGKGHLSVFERMMHTSMLERFELGLDLRKALDRQELLIHFQPIVDLRGGRIVGAEALVRWNHPAKGLLPPGDFIELAEKIGVMRRLGSWVLERSCQEARAWGRGNADPYVSVNVSASQLLEDSFSDEVRDALRSAGLPARRLVLEVTETTLLRDRSGAARRLARLRELGVRIAIDDFGTGYSSLSQLRDLPFDILKIDRSFVEAMARERTAFVGLIVQLCRQMNLDTIAEGVESWDQVRELLGHGCHKGQGYLFSRAMPVADISRLLDSDARLMSA